ncbi:hypothetical protein FSP39_024895 [Pinctada imbricata]|uniref:Uncharacterized protein n=1 Tax=Pinctada imbricata TaxID=66713 RepID=A0AA89BJV6_PINIB|nr:hypothetical protein FSP39_024895 [Pinctada imbricata]
MYGSYSECKRFALVIQFLVLEVSDLGFDWDFYAEVSKSERFKGDAISWAIFVFAFWGTILFMLDGGWLIIAVCDGKPSEAEDVVNCLTTWTEDIPQMIMAVYIAVLVQEPITGLVQYTKAMLAILESAIRCIIIIARCCGCSDDDDDERCCPKFADTVNFIGYLIIAICAIVVLVIFAG